MELEFSVGTSTFELRKSWKATEAREANHHRFAVFHFISYIFESFRNLPTIVHEPLYDVPQHDECLSRRLYANIIARQSGADTENVTPCSSFDDHLYPLHRSPTIRTTSCDIPPPMDRITSPRHMDVVEPEHTRDGAAETINSGAYFHNSAKTCGSRSASRHIACAGYKHLGVCFTHDEHRYFTCGKW
jgi:hypothetical protein